MLKFHYKFFKLSVKNSEFRNCHGSVICKNKLHIFGGSGENSGIVSEVLVDPSMRSNSRLVLKNITVSKPIQRLGHTVIEYNNLIYIFGGKNPVTNELLNDVISYNPGFFII
jgi:N-acetylneuraminic acid mutarotase